MIPRLPNEVEASLWHAKRCHQEPLRVRKALKLCRAVFVELHRLLKGNINFNFRVRESFN